MGGLNPPIRTPKKRLISTPHMPTPLISPFDPGATLPSAADRSKKVGDAEMGKDEFLKLLVTQLGNQDPMNPMDGQQFAAQLAQFTSVEQLMNISSTLAENSAMNGMLAQSINSGVAAGLIGKSVETASDSINVDAENPAKLAFRLDDTADSVKVTIRDEAGNLVRELNLDGRSSGDHEYEWDGTDLHGQRVKEGVYKFEVKATTQSGETVGSEGFFRGQVDRITFGQDGIMLWIGKVKVPMADVESVE